MPVRILRALATCAAAAWSCPADATPMLALGSAHSCAADSRGAAWCWGDNSSGQLGDGQVGALLRLDVLGIAGGVAALGAGFQHSCALTTAGAVKCWGSNTFGELGDNTTTVHVAAGEVSGLSSGVVAIAIGASFGCALTNAGAVRCWGKNSGNLGTGDTSDRSTPAVVLGLGAAASAIAAGEAHACALIAGAVKCWGLNGAGQLGDGTTTTRLTATDVTGLPAGITGIAVGQRHSCALTAAGGVKCWGENDHGQLGDGTTTDRTRPVDVTGLQSGVRALALSTNASCALMVSGTVKCWGGNDFAEQGTGGTPARNLAPVDVPGLAAIAGIASGFNHFCVRDQVGAMRCWGLNRLGQLGNGTTHDGETPQPVVGLAGPVLAMGLGGLHSCAALASGIKCWGSNLSGQLGNVTSRRYNIAGPVSGLSTGVAQVAATDSSTCALVNGGVKCWGSNRNGELGDGTTTDHALPANVSGLASGVLDIAAGAMYACALVTGGGVRCWGSDATLNTTSRAIAGLASGVTRIATGAQHGCAIVASGAVRCWGRNERGQLGNGQTTTTNTPVDVAGLASGATGIAAGTLHSCALLATGRIKCWGANDTGQLGNGTTTSSITPVDVIGIGRAIGLTAFVDTTCALTASGAVWCWGQVSGGRRGVPWQVPTLANAVTGIAASNTHACFMVAGGGVRCFGNNAAGQLGDGTHVIERRTPETVVAADGASFLDLTPEDPLIRSLLSPFVAITTASGSNVTAQVQVPPGAGTTNIYVFALAPAARVSGAKAEKDDSVACVLAQLNASGQLTAVSTTSLQAYATGVATGQSQAVTVLNGVPTATIAGTQFYVGLGASPTTMLTSGSTRSVVSTAGDSSCKPQTPQTGWWWSTTAGGRGYSIEVAGNHIFFASYLYEVGGRATWQVASGSTSVDGSLFIGKLESYSGGQTLAGAFRPTMFAGYVGDITLAFSDETHGTLILPGEALAIERFNIVPNGLSLVPGTNQPESGWWWNPAESGRGFFLEWQGNQLFMAGYMYDDAGNPLWYLSGDSVPSSNLLNYANVWQQYGNGQSMGGPYKAPVAVNTNVGPVTIQFSSDEAGLMTLPGGRTTAIQRFRF